ncbi:hypothetical protein TNCV_2773431 [Trichonephila clavipes]|nr:hypothetical protein TNCV_2773431 [Trichonephila clavipes]
MLPENKKLRQSYQGLVHWYETGRNNHKTEKPQYSRGKECHSMTNRKSRAPKPLFVVICTTSENNRLLYKIKELNHMKIKVELLRKKYALQQCYRCQSFFHSSKFCTRAPVVSNVQEIIRSRFAKKV